MKRSILLFSILLILLTGCGPKEPVTSLYSDLLSEYGIQTKDQHTLAEFSYSVLDHYFNEDVKQKDMSSTAFQEFDYDMVFITYLNEGSLRCSYGGGSDSMFNRLANDLLDANLDCIEDERFGGAISADEIDTVEIVFSFLFNRTKLHYNSLDDLENKIELGINAIELEAGGRTAYFKESVPISHNYDLEYTLLRLCLKADQEEDCYLDSGSDLYIYDTYTFKVDRDYTVTDLHRYSAYVDLKSIISDSILQRL
ncbi:MAG TPA: AMMECR1 domain-containing protein, partial [Anaerolineales bacterium]|nr:AMMECR1 domain-containing protein [Anaerolineales bacterium]